MKKVIIMLAAAVCSLASMAAEYTGKLTVSVNGVGASMETTIQAAKENGKVNFDLKNFCLKSEDGLMGVGNISLHNLDGTDDCGYTNIKFDDKITIAEGDLEGIDFWIGPALEEVPIVMNCDFNDTALSVNIDIDMVDSLGQVIKVNFVGTAPSIKGDVNGDGGVDVSDVNAIINVILGI